MKRTVVIPACENHAGFHSMNVTINWVCPVCGGARGEPVKTMTWDGSRRLECDGWTNPCGHIDKYSDIRKEASLMQIEDLPQVVAENTMSEAKRTKIELSQVLGELPKVREWMDYQHDRIRPNITKLCDALEEVAAIREPVRWFAEQMEATLKKNDYKGGWDKEAPGYLLDRLYEEFHELLTAVEGHDSSEEIISEATDVANIAMMIADLARKKVEE